MTVAAAIEIGTRAPHITGGRGFPEAMTSQGAASASTSDVSGTDSFRSRWQALVEAEGENGAVKPAALRKQPISDSAFASSMQGMRKTSARPGGAGAPEPSAQQAGQTDAQASLPETGLAVVKAATVAAKPSLTSSNEGPGNSSAKRGKVQSAAAAGSATGTVITGIDAAAVPTTQAVAVPVQFAGSDLSHEAGADQTESTDLANAQTLLAAGGAAKFSTPGGQDSGRNSPVPSNTATAAFDGTTATFQEADPIGGTKSLAHEVEGFSLPKGQALPQADSAKQASGSAVPECPAIPKLVPSSHAMSGADGDPISN